MWVERVLGLTGRDDARAAFAKASVFSWFIVFHVMVEEWILITNQVPGADPVTIVANALGHPRSAFGAGLTVAFVLACFGATRRLGVAVAAATTLGIIAFETFPATANHAYLQLAILCVVLSFDLRHEEECTVLLQGCRLVMVIVLLYAGLKKALFGTYFSGQMFAVLLVESERYAALRWALDAADLAHLDRLGPPAHGVGPYRLSSPFGLAMSHGAYLAEIGCAIGMLVPRARGLAAVGALVMLALIEIFAREVPFGIFFATLILLFLPAAVLRPAVIAFVAADVVMMLTRLEIFPWWEFV